MLSVLGEERACLERCFSVARSLASPRGLGLVRIPVAVVVAAAACSFSIYLLCSSGLGKRKREGRAGKRAMLDVRGPVESEHQEMCSSSSSSSLFRCSYFVRYRYRSCFSSSASPIRDTHKEPGKVPIVVDLACSLARSPLLPSTGQRSCLDTSYTG